MTPEQRKRAERDMLRAIEAKIWAGGERGMAHPQYRQIVEIALTALLRIADVKMKETDND